MKFLTWKRSIGYITRKMPNLEFPSESEFETRQRMLSGCGLLAFEKRVFSFYDTSTPAMKSMLRQRREMFLAAKVTFKGYNQYAQRIRAWYRKQGWVMKTPKDKLSPWEMFRWYKQKDDQPDTPQSKPRRRGRKDYASMKEKTISRRREVRRRLRMHEGEA